MVTFRNPSSVHIPIGGYSHQVEIAGAVKWLILSGQVGKEIDGSIPADPISQIELALDNIARNLEAAGMGMRDIVKLAWYLVGQVDADRRLEVVARRFSNHNPCSTVIYVARLARPEYCVEIDAWAVAGVTP